MGLARQPAAGRPSSPADAEQHAAGRVQQAIEMATGSTKQRQTLTSNGAVKLQAAFADKVHHTGEIIDVASSLRPLGEKKLQALLARQAHVWLIDCSGSMCGTPIESVRRELKEWLDILGNTVPDGKVGVIAFESDARVAQQWSTNAEVSKKAKELQDQLQAGGGTSIRPALELCESEWLEKKEESHVVLHLMTDGAPSDGASALAKCQELQEKYNIQLVLHPFFEDGDYGKPFMDSLHAQVKGSIWAPGNSASIREFMARHLPSLEFETRVKMSIPADLIGTAKIKGVATMKRESKVSIHELKEDEVTIIVPSVALEGEVTLPPVSVEVADLGGAQEDLNFLDITVDTIVPGDTFTCTLHLLADFDVNDKVQIVPPPEVKAARVFLRTVETIDGVTERFDATEERHDKLQKSDRRSLRRTIRTRVVELSQPDISRTTASVEVSAAMLHGVLAKLRDRQVNDSAALRFLMDANECLEMEAVTKGLGIIALEAQGDERMKQSFERSVKDNELIPFLKFRALYLHDQQAGYVRRRSLTAAFARQTMLNGLLSIARRTFRAELVVVSKDGTETVTEVVEDETWDAVLIKFVKKKQLQDLLGDHEPQGTEMAGIFDEFPDTRDPPPADDDEEHEAELAKAKLAEQVKHGGDEPEEPEDRPRAASRSSSRQSLSQRVSQRLSLRASVTA